MKSKKSNNQAIKPTVKRGRGRPKKIITTAIPYKKLKTKPTSKKPIGKIINDDLDFGTDMEFDNPKIAKPKRPASHYVDNKRFEKLIREYYKTDIFSEELGEMINKISQHVTYMPRFVNYCVDERTEALTKRGWLKYDQITTDDFIMAYDVQNECKEWSSIKEIFINPLYVGRAYRITSTPNSFDGAVDIDAIVTSGHRFIKFGGDEPSELMTIEDIIKNKYSIVLEEHNIIRFDNLHIEILDNYSGLVWCPKTEYGTWICRRNGVVYVTGNTYHDAMISDSNYKMIKALNERKFNPDKGSAFSYFTKICIHSFFYITEKERKNHTTVENYQNEMYDELMLHGYINNAVDNENHYE